MDTYDKNIHLDPVRISQYAEAMHLDKLASVPEPILEHVENCAQCHAEVVNLYAILHQVENDLQDTVVKKEARILTFRPFYRLALVASVAALAIFTYFKVKPTNAEIQNLPVIAEDSLKNESPGIQLTDKETFNKKNIEKNSDPNNTVRDKMDKQKNTADLFAANFEPLDDYEALIGTTFRSAPIKINGPANDHHSSKEEIITFSWDLENSEFLYITILNNEEDILTRQEITDSTFSTQLEIPGLYYWKLEDESEILHVGKFYIDK